MRAGGNTISKSTVAGRGHRPMMNPPNGDASPRAGQFGSMAPAGTWFARLRTAMGRIVVVATAGTAIVGLTRIAPAVSAHQTAPPGNDVGVSNRRTLMEEPMRQHADPDGFAWMETQMDHPIDETARAASNGHTGPHAHGCWRQANSQSVGTPRTNITAENHIHLINDGHTEQRR